MVILSHANGFQLACGQIEYWYWLSNSNESKIPFCNIFLPLKLMQNIVNHLLC